MLVLLKRANLFLVPLDEVRHGYRLHDLFREAQLTSLSTTHPELVPVLHRRAAHFYEIEGQWDEAITHALAAADFSTAALLMEQTVEQFWLHREVPALPEPAVGEHAHLVLTTALYLLNTVPQTTGEQRARVHQQVQQLARVETALLLAQVDKANLSREVTRAGAIAALPPNNLETLTAKDC